MKGLAVQTFGAGSSEVLSFVQPLLLHLGGRLKLCVGERCRPGSSPPAVQGGVNVTALVRLQLPTGASLGHEQGLVWFPRLCRDGFVELCLRSL